MSKNIVDFNEYKAAKESKKKKKGELSPSEFIPDSPDDSDPNVPDMYALQNLLSSVSGMFSDIMSEAAEFESYDDYLSMLKENHEALLEEEPKSKKSHKFFEWFSKVIHADILLHLADALGSILKTGREIIDKKIPLIQSNRVYELDLGVKLPIETEDDLVAVNDRIEEIMEMERNGEATEKDLDTKSTLLAILVWYCRDIMADLLAEEPRKSKKSQHRKWEQEIYAANYNLNCFYYMCGSSYTEIFDNLPPNKSLEGLPLGDDLPKELADLPDGEFLDFLNAILDQGNDDEDFDDYDDGQFDFFDDDDFSFGDYDDDDYDDDDDE